MKQIFIILCSLLLAIPLAACGASDEQPLTTTTSVIQTQPVIQSTEVSSGNSIEESFSSESSTTSKETSMPLEAPKKDTVRSMQITVGNNTFSATLAENSAVDALIELMRNAPVVINMSDYSGFEKVGSLGTSLPTSNSSLTVREGDIVLYNGNQIVAFYGVNSWSYTRIGRIDNLSGWKEAIGNGDVTITFSIK